VSDNAARLIQKTVADAGGSQGRVGYGLDWIGLDWVGLDWIGSGLIGLDWVRIDWIGLGGLTLTPSTFVITAGQLMFLTNYDL